MMMIPRAMLSELQKRAETNRVVTLTGPRQAGKTTLARAAFPNHLYLDFEDPEVQEHARTDPQEFIMQIKDNTILDEPQKAPELFPYLQAALAVAEPRGRFVLIASENRMPPPAAAATNMQLLPLAYSEIARTRPLHLENLGWFVPVRRDRGGQRPDLLDVLIVGGYPQVHRQYRGCLPPAATLAEHFKRYLERDLADFLRVSDNRVFGRFMRLCAGRNSLAVNLSALAADCGITHPTARRWLAVLESSFLITRIWPHRHHFHTRRAKSPKLFFLDTGLLCYLLRIRNAAELRTHPGRSAVFKSFVVSEFAKNFLNRGLAARLAYWRGPRGREVDLIVDTAETTVPVEIKSGRTAAPDFFATLDYWCVRSGNERSRGIVVYGGDQNRSQRGHLVLSWSAL